MRVTLLALLFLLPAPCVLAQGAPDATVNLLEKLTNAPGPPGAEEAVRAIMVDHMKPLASSLQV